jgi:hypothetical protein
MAPSKSCLAMSEKRILSEVKEVDSVKVSFNKVLRAVVVSLKTPVHYESRKSYKVLRHALTIAVSECENREYTDLPTSETRYGYAGLADSSHIGGKAHGLRKFRNAGKFHWKPSDRKDDSKHHHLDTIQEEEISRLIKLQKEMKYKTEEGNNLYRKLLSDHTHRPEKLVVGVEKRTGERIQWVAIYPDKLGEEEFTLVYSRPLKSGENKKRVKSFCDDLYGDYNEVFVAWGNKSFCKVKDLASKK